MSSPNILHLNQSGPTEFVFRMFTTSPRIQALLFCFFLLLYVMILCGNTTIICIVCTHSSLRTPMYFFLSNLSFLEICYTTTVVPLMLSNIFGAQSPSHWLAVPFRCFFFLLLVVLIAFYWLPWHMTAMWPSAIPLHYTLIMTQKRCTQLVVGSMFLALILDLQLTVLICTLPFCGHILEINHFLCDAPPVLRLACGDIKMHQAILFMVGILVLTVPFLLISISYIFIAKAILCIQSAEGRRRAFSTCSSHLSVVVLQYGCSSLVYMRPRSSTSEDEDRHLALIYTFVIPLLNPLIYTLRNKDVKDALKKSMSCKRTSEIQ